MYINCKSINTPILKIVVNKLMYINFKSINTLIFIIKQLKFKVLYISVLASQTSDDVRSVEKYWDCHNKLLTYANSAYYGVFFFGWN